MVALQEFLDVIFALPTVLFTVPLALSLLYWAFVIVGAADLDLLGGADGALESTADGVVEGVAEASGETGLAWVMSALRLKSAPVTVVGSFFSLFGWLLSAFGTTWLGPVVGESLPGWALHGLVFLGALLGSVVVTSAAVRPLAPLFEHTTSRGGRHLVGKLCVVRTGRVDAHFGQAEMNDGGAGLLLHIRCADDSTLQKGDEALVIDYDAQRDVYLVAPMKGLLPGETGADKVPAPGERETTPTAVS